MQSTAVQILWAWAHGGGVGDGRLRYGATIMYDRKRHAALQKQSNNNILLICGQFAPILDLQQVRIKIHSITHEI